MQVRSKAGEGSKRALGFEAADVSSQADTDMLTKSAGGSEADLCEMLSARDELMNRCFLVHFLPFCVGRSHPDCVIRMSTAQGICALQDMAALQASKGYM